MLYDHIAVAHVICNSNLIVIQVDLTNMEFPQSF